MLGLVGRLGRKATTTKLFTVSNKSNEFTKFLDSIDWTTDVAELQAQLEQGAQQYQQTKVADRNAALIQTGAASQSSSGRALKAKYIQKFGQLITSDVPTYLTFQGRPDPAILNSLGQVAFDFLKQIGQDDKDNALANKLAQTILTVVFDSVYNNSKLIADNDESEFNPESVIECGTLYTECARSIGRQIELVARLRSYKEQDPKYFSSLFWKYLKDPIFGEQFAVNSVDSKASDHGLVWDSWSEEQVTKLGNYFLIKLCTVPLTYTKNSEGKTSKSPLFVTQFVRFSKTEQYAYVIPGSVLVNNAAVVAQIAKENAFFKPPLLIPPVNHSNDQAGGYHTDAALSTQKLVRKFHNLPIVIGEKPLAAINKLQQVPYTINTFVLDHLPAIKAELVARANAARVLNPERWVTPKLGHYNPFVQGLSRRASRNTYKTETVVAVANKIQGRAFYHAWSFDYRGRLYPISTVLTPQSTDFEKSLLKFHVAGEVTESAKYWLKVQVANTFGLDNKPLSERVSWVEENLDRITSVATDPVANLDLWSETSEPWQFLAACEEFYACVITGERKVSNLPVAVDATCSGIQILAGITLDAAAAQTVNVVPDSFKHDAYGEVAARALEVLRKKPVESFDQVSAVFDRKVVKSVVMTVPYNASSQKNTDQIRTALRAKGVTVSNDDASAIAVAVRSALSEVLPGPLAFRKWLNTASRQKAKTLNGSPLSWTTPSGFPVLQLKNKIETVTIDSIIGGNRKKLKLAVGFTNETNVSQHATATAPNLIHSLDASILHLAINEFGDSQFTTIHDSVLARACDLDTVQTQLRVAYSDIFSNDIAGEIAVVLDAAKPYKVVGSLNPEVVKESEYFFC